MISGDVCEEMESLKTIPRYWILFWGKKKKRFSLSKEIGIRIYNRRMDKQNVIYNYTMKCWCSAVATRTVACQAPLSMKFSR